MSDRMSNVEIEDVLSSIRRLVSEDLRVASPVAEPAFEQVPRLVLTPALRVDRPVRQPKPPVPQPAVETPQPDLAVRLAELEAILDAQEQSFDDEADSVPDVPLAIHRIADAAEAPFYQDDTEDAGAVPAVQDDVQAPAALSEPVGQDVSMHGPMVDEALLRDLIRDVLREELQGEIGERVTRNLRKMIRTEIGRALTARGIV